MICYQDKTFCESKVKKHTCNREFVEDENYKRWSKRLGVKKGPVALAKFCKEQDTE